MPRLPLPRGTAPVLVLVTSAVVLTAGAFAFGRAEASRETERRRTPVVRVIDHAGPAVVSVHADSRSRRGYLRRGAGSGVIVHPDGYVVTNAHVIQGGQRFHVQLFRESRSLECRVVVNWPQNDLALLKIEGGNRKFRYVSLSPTCDVMLGETAIAIGNPRGLGDTITVGVVSAMGRDAKLSSGAALRDLIQTDASINTGNSGGALLNLDGELIGIIVSLLPRATGIAFAIPCDQVNRLLERGLRSRAAANPLPTPRPMLPEPAPRMASSHRERAPSPGDGPVVRKPEPRVSTPEPAPRRHATNPLRSSDFGFEVRDTGVDMRVLSVAPDSAADEAGMNPSDVLLAIDGSPVEAQADLLLAFSRSRPGQAYAVEVRRRGSRKLLVLVVPR